LPNFWREDQEFLKLRPSEAITLGRRRLDQAPAANNGKAGTWHDRVGRPWGRHRTTVRHEAAAPHDHLIRGAFALESADDGREGISAIFRVGKAEVIGVDVIA
jgi:hypothetical protein